MCSPQDLFVPPFKLSLHIFASRLCGFLQTSAVFLAIIRVEMGNSHAESDYDL